MEKTEQFLLAAACRVLEPEVYLILIIGKIKNTQSTHTHTHTYTVWVMLHFIYQIKQNMTYSLQQLESIHVINRPHLK